MNPELYVLSEGKLKDKWNALANASTKKALDEFIKRKNYIGARDELGRNKMYLTQEEYDRYLAKIKQLDPNNKIITLNTAEKSFLNNAYNFIMSEYNKLKKNYMYKDEKELQKLVYIEKGADHLDDRLFISNIGIDTSDEQLMELFNDFTSDLENAVDKKYKDIIGNYSDYYDNKGVVTFYVDRDEIPGNKEN
jgi:hypothetical protein